MPIAPNSRVRPADRGDHLAEVAYQDVPILVTGRLDQLVQLHRSHGGKPSQVGTLGVLARGEDPQAQCIFHTASRFSRNAATPSMMSSVVNASASCARSASNA